MNRFLPERGLDFSPVIRISITAATSRQSPRSCSAPQSSSVSLTPTGKRPIRLAQSVVDRLEGVRFRP
jgi:hypothetical protein